jgi:hypothetical protein
MSSPVYGTPQQPLDLTTKHDTSSVVPESVRSGRQRTGTVSTAIIGVAAAGFISADSKRVALRISPPSAGRVTISDNPSVIIDAGITLSSGTAALELTVEVYGQFITKKLFAIADAAGRQIGWIESRLEAT